MNGPLGLSHVFEQFNLEQNKTSRSPLARRPPVVISERTTRPWIRVASFEVEVSGAFLQTRKEMLGSEKGDVHRGYRYRSRKP